MKYGKLNHLGIEVNESIAELLERYHTLLWAARLRTPRELWKEIRQISRITRTPWMEILAHNLNYEAVGGCCKSMVLPRDDGNYGMYRVLEWTIPPQVRTCFRWDKLGPGVHIRKLNGYVGALAGYRPGGYGADPGGCAMNMASIEEYEPINWLGLPASWRIRRWMAEGMQLDRIPLIGPVVRAAYLIAYDGNIAEWWCLKHDGSHVLRARAVWPEPLAVGNSKEQISVRLLAFEAVWPREPMTVVKDPTGSSIAVDTVIV